MAESAATNAVSIDMLDGPTPALNSAADTIRWEGFVEQEFRISGSASRYRLADPSSEAQRVDTDHLFATRVLVRRPRDLADFNGTVIVEWLNVSTGQDLDFVYAATRELILREGYAWVGASVQRVGVERLAQWNPVRYGTLSVAAPADDPNTGMALDPANPVAGAAGGDVLCWDIYSQVANAIRHDAKRLIGVTSVNRVIAAGESQSALRLSRYFNAFQPLFGLFDGFLLYDRGGPQRLRTDLPAKLISIGSEFFAEYEGGGPQWDGENQRWWDLAGASHVSLAEMRGYIDPQVRRDGIQRVHGRATTLTAALEHEHGCPNGPLWSRVPNADLMKAALDALIRWIGDGVAPRSASRLAVDDQRRLIRDAEGRVSGGIRYAAYEVPTARNVGVTNNGARLAGYHLDFTPEEMTRRYGNLAAYVDRVTSVVQQNLAQRLLLYEEASRVIGEAWGTEFSR